MLRSFEMLDFTTVDYFLFFFLMTKVGGFGCIGVF